MKNRLVALALLLSVVITFSGCFPTGEKDPNTSVEEFKSGIFEYNADNIEVSFEIPEVPNNLPAKIKIKNKIFETDDILEVFLNGKTIDHVALDTNYWTTDGSLLTVDENCLGFRDGKTCNPAKFQAENPVNYQVILLLYKDYLRNEFFESNVELDGFPSRDAIERAQNFASSLGITNLGNPEIYTASLESYEKIRGGFGDFFNNTYPLTNENEVYFLMFSQEYEDVGLANLYQASVKDSTNKDGIDEVFSPKVTIGISRDQIFYFNVEEAYESNYEVLSDDPLKYDLNYALNELKSFLEKNHFSKKNIIDKAELVYLPTERNETGNLELVPAWCFNGYEFVGNNADPSNYSEYLVNYYKIVISSESGVMNRYMEG